MHISNRRSGSSRRARATASRCSRRDEEGHLAAVDDDLLDGVGVGAGAGLDQGALEAVGDLVEVAAVGPLRRRRATAIGRHQAAVARWCRRPSLAPNMPRRSPTTTGSASVPGGGRQVAPRTAGRRAGRPVVRSPSGGLAPGVVASRHASRPFIACVGVAVRAAASAARAAVSRLTPSGVRLDLLVQRDDRVEQHLGPRRAAGQVDVDRDDVVDALDDRVVVEHAAASWRRRPSR